MHAAPYSPNVNNNFSEFQNFEHRNCSDVLVKVKDRYKILRDDIDPVTYCQREYLIKSCSERHFTQILACVNTIIYYIMFFNSMQIDMSYIIL